MNKQVVKKVLVLLLIIVVLRVTLIAALNYINIAGSHYIDSAKNVINIDTITNRHLYTVVSGRQGGITDQILYIKSGANANQHFQLLITNLTFPHRISINDQVISQNMNKDTVSYDSDYASKGFDIGNSQYVENTVNVGIVGDKAETVGLFLADNKVAKDSNQIRTIVHVVLLVFLLSATLISLVMYVYNRNEHYFLVFAQMGIVSTFKAIILGEISVLSRLLGITAYNFAFFDNLTNIINTILPLFIVCYLFDYQIKAKQILMGLGAVLLLGVGIFIRGLSFFSFYGILFATTFILTNVIMILAYLKDKPLSRVILVNGVIYSSCVIYYLLVVKGTFPSGSLLFFTNPPYLGAVLYMGGFLLAILLKHLDKVRLLEANKREYERTLLLRGISHDLKLPLSVIKLNNQMIEKYDLPEDELKEYVATSLEATLELEKMTDNINSYLSMNKISSKGENTSVKECFEKMRHYYNRYNRDDNYKFSVECDDEDCMLEVNPLHFSRMLYNLIDNAFKYNEGGVEVKASYEIGEKLWICIEDNGVGIDGSEAYKVFKPFYRVDPSRTISGLGLGLSVVKQVVESLKGTIQIDSKNGAGTKIIIAIPR